MSDIFCMTRKFNVEGDRSRLRNAFRVMSEPEHKLREKAIWLRQEISSTWGNYAAQNKWFPWPTTIALLGTRKLKGIEWRPHGMLSFLGYHVGETDPTPLTMRRSILEYTFECHLPPHRSVALPTIHNGACH